MQQELVKLGNIQLIRSQNKPNKCKVCKNRTNQAIYIRCGVNTIGTVWFCQNCHCWHVTGKKWMESGLKAVDLVDEAKRLVE